jgi:hypothetical protein
VGGRVGRGTPTHAPLEIDDPGTLVHRNGKLYYADLGGV